MLRLIRLRNLESLHAKQDKRINRLQKKIQLLEQENILLKKMNGELTLALEDFKLQIEELRTMVFGKKKKSKEIDENLTPRQEKIPRTSDSYKRPAPKDEEVTETKHHVIDRCACGEKMTKKERVIFYEENIPIPAAKIVRKHLVEKAYCANCKKWSTAIPLPPSQVILGPNVQKYTCYLSIICRISFSQIQGILKDTYQIHVSQGEIANILNREAMKLKPFYEQLKVTIRGEPVIHLDETSWKLFMGDGYTYCWVMSGGESKENVFLVGESRGKGNMETLVGENFAGFVVSDDYGAYRTLQNHQLCWAHLIRKFRDIAQSEELSDNQRQQCKKDYAMLCVLYDDLKQNRRMERYGEFAQRLFDLSVIAPNDPRKLIRVKTTLRKNIPLYLTCLSDPRIPLTNNQAERSLRHLVLKRKISFGSLTKRTADNLAVLLSVLMSLKQRFQSNFFAEYLRV